jgi:hypothetical protein
VEEALDVWSQFWKELRRDHSRQFLLRIEDPATVPVGAIPAVGEENVVYLDSKEISAEQLSCAPDSDHCTLELDGVQFSDKGLLDFRRS